MGLYVSTVYIPCTHAVLLPGKDAVLPCAEMSAHRAACAGLSVLAWVMCIGGGGV